MDNFDNENSGASYGGAITSPFIGSAEGGCDCAVDGGYKGGYTGGGMLTDMMGFDKSNMLSAGNARAALAAFTLVLILALMICVVVGYKSELLPVITLCSVFATMGVDLYMRVPGMLA